MLIQDLYTPRRPVISFEVFPPKKDDDISSIYGALEQMAALNPDFISVTYGAGGCGNTNRTAEVASFVNREYGIRTLAHLTCIGAGRSGIRRILDQLHAEGIRNILALRGDPPSIAPSSAALPPSRDAGSSDLYLYAEELIRDIRSHGGFCVGAACYPEGHISCDNLNLDLDHLRLKQEAGASFFISQLFFDNDIFFNFLDKARAHGITQPIAAGVMPILGRSQIERMVFMCGASLPSGIIKLLHKYEHNPADLRKAGIDFAARQMMDLLEQGIDGVHIYTMNKPEIARTCMQAAQHDTLRPPS